MSNPALRPDWLPSFQTVPNTLQRVGGIAFAYRDVGPRDGTPLLLLNHWGAVLDNFDPRIIDGFARHRRVIAIDYRGIGLSGGTAPTTVAEMAQDTVAFIRAMGLEQVDLLGFSLGGFVAQELALRDPHRVRRLILAGTGPAGGNGIDDIWSLSWPLMIKGLLTFRDPKTYLFFTSTRSGREAAKAFLNRLKERKADRDKGPTPRAFYNQLKAIEAWGRQAEQDLTRLRMPVLIANGDNDIMVPTVLSHQMARRIPHAQLVIYPDAGHGGVFQYHVEFQKQVLTFLS